MSPRFGDTYRRALREAVEGKQSLDQADAKFGAYAEQTYGTRDYAQIAEYYKADPSRLQEDLKACGLDRASLLKATEAQKTFAPLEEQRQARADATNADIAHSYGDTLRRLPPSVLAQRASQIEEAVSIDGEDIHGAVGAAVVEVVDPADPLADIGLRRLADREQEQLRADRAAMLATTDDELQAGFRAAGVADDDTSSSGSGVLAVNASIPETVVGRDHRGTTVSAADLALMDARWDARPTQRDDNLRTIVPGDSRNRR